MRHSADGCYYVGDKPCGAGVLGGLRKDDARLTDRCGFDPGLGLTYLPEGYARGIGRVRADDDLPGGLVCVSAVGSFGVQCLQLYRGIVLGDDGVVVQCAQEPGDCLLEFLAGDTFVSACVEQSQKRIVAVDRADRRAGGDPMGLIQLDGVLQIRCVLDGQMIGTAPLLKGHVLRNCHSF